MTHESNVTRRDFVKTTAVLSAGAVLTPGLAYGRGDSDTLRVGLIGCGGRGTSAAGQALSADKGVVLHAMGDAFSDRLNSSHKNLTNQAGERVQAPEERRFVGFDAYQKVIDSGVDVVILTTPPHFRPQHLRAAVDANKHIFCEKPMAVDAPGVRSVIASADEARRKGLNLMSGFCWRYSYPERATYKKLHEGAIGDIVSVHTTYHTSTLGKRPRQEGWSDMEWQLRNWWHFTWLSGDHIAEQACHSIDKINWALDGEMPVRCNSLGGRQCRSGPESGNAYDHFAVVYEYANNTRSFHTCRQIPNCVNDNSDYITGTKGQCFVNGWAPRHQITGENEWYYNYDEGGKPNMYQVEHNELFASIRAGKVINDGTDMANSTMMSLMGRMAAYTGQTVSWDQAMNSQEDLTPPHYEWGDLEMPAVAMPGQTKFV